MQLNESMVISHSQKQNQVVKKIDRTIQCEYLNQDLAAAATKSGQHPAI